MITREGEHHAPRSANADTGMERLSHRLLSLRANLRGVQRRHDRDGTQGRRAAYGTVYPPVQGMCGHLWDGRSLDEPGVTNRATTVRSLRRCVRAMRQGVRRACSASCSVRALCSRMSSMCGHVPSHVRGYSESGLTSRSRREAQSKHTIQCR